MKKSVPLALLILLAVLGCSFGSLVGQAPTPTPTPTRTLKPTFTPIPTASPTPTATDTPVPTDTPTPTETPTNTPIPTPTSPPAATPTPKPPTATPTPAVPTPTPTPAVPTPTPTPSLPYKGHGPWYEPNCASTWVEGTVWDRDGTTGVNGVLVKLWTEGFTFPLFESGKWADHPSGFYEFTIGAGYVRPGTWYIALVDAGGGLISDVIMFQTTANCGWPDGQQEVTVDFVRQ